MDVRELLQLPELQVARPTVLAGEPHLDREIRWVHTGEIAGISEFLRGGEVLLTAATGLGETEAEQRRYVAELADVRIAALIFELGIAFAAIPDAIVDEARRRGLILVQLAEVVPFIAVTQAVHTRLINSTHETLTRALEIDDALNRLILDGASLSALLELLAERLSNPVVLEDGARHVVAFGRSASPIAPLLRGWAAHSRVGHAGAGTGLSVQDADSEPRCAWSPIALRGRVWGRLHLLEVDAGVDSVARMALGRAAASIALHLLGERDAELSEAAERSLLQDLARADRFNGREFLDRATGLGVDLDGELVVVVAGRGEAGGELDPGAADLRLRSFRDALRDARLPGLVGTVDGEAVAVVPATADNLAGALRDAVARMHAGSADRAHLGVSRPARAMLLPRAYGEALAAHRLGPTATDGHVHLYDDLALHRLLAPLLSGPELANFVEEELGVLLAYDAEHKADLVHTLDAFLESNGSKAAAAQRLHLQRRSVYYRLGRIEELLERSLDDPIGRVRLYVALRARELLEVRDPALAAI